MNSHAHAPIYNFSDNEKRTLEALAKQEHSFTSLSLATGIARTTLYTTIDALKKRKLASVQGKRKNQKIYITKDITGDQALSPTANTILDIESMFTIYKQVITSTKHVQAIQSQRSMLAGITSFEEGRFITLNETIKKKHIVVEAILEERTFDTYVRTITKETTKKALIQSFSGRASELIVVPNNTLPFEAEVIITRETVLFVNWKSKSLSIIKDRASIELIKHMFESVKLTGKRISFGDYINSVKQ